MPPRPVGLLLIPFSFKSGEGEEPQQQNVLLLYPLRIGMKYS